MLATYYLDAIGRSLLFVGVPLAILVFIVSRKKGFVRFAQTSAALLIPPVCYTVWMIGLGIWEVYSHPQPTQEQVAPQNAKGSQSK